MRKYIFYITVIFLLYPGNAFSFDWEANKISIVSKMETDGRIDLMLRDDKGVQFRVISDGLEDKTAANIIRIKDNFSSWKNMKMESITFSHMDGLLDIIIIPAKFEYNRVNIRNYITAGMQFSYPDYLQYNFRIAVNKLFVRIKGDFTDETKFCEKIIDAVKNPQLYIKKRDPEYFLSRIEEMEKKMADTNAQLEDTRTRLADANTQKDKLRVALMALQNEGFFSGPTPISQKVVERVIQMKDKNPKLKAEQISEALEKEKIEVSKKEVNIILNVYFNEYEK
jgi:hypothetical protein